MPEQRDLNTPLLLSCKFGYLDLVKVFLRHNTDITYENRKKMNCLDMAIVNGDYHIAYYLYLKDVKIKTYQEYKDFIQVPSFDLRLFYSTLINKTSPDETPSFSLRPKNKLNETNTEKKIRNNEDENVNEPEGNFASSLFGNKKATHYSQDLTLSSKLMMVIHNI